MTTAVLSTYRVEAFNTAKASENKIHDDATARRFGLGYAPAEGLARALERAKAPLPEAQTLGLVGPSKSGSGWSSAATT